MRITQIATTARFDPTHKLKNVEMDKKEILILSNNEQKFGLRTDGTTTCIVMCAKITNMEKTLFGMLHWSCASSASAAQTEAQAKFREFYDYITQEAANIGLVHTNRGCTIDMSFVGGEKKSAQVRGSELEQRALLAIKSNYRHVTFTDDFNVYKMTEDRISVSVTLDGVYYKRYGEFDMESNGSLSGDENFGANSVFAAEIRRDIGTLKNSQNILIRRIGGLEIMMRQLLAQRGLPQPPQQTRQAPFVPLAPPAPPRREQMQQRTLPPLRQGQQLPPATRLSAPTIARPLAFPQKRKRNEDEELSNSAFVDQSGSKRRKL